MSDALNPIRTTDLKAKKQQGSKITMLTVYDATMARLLDRAGIDVLLVGDSLGMVIMGYETTLPVTLEAMLHHTRAVANGTTHALLVADMPFLTFQVSASEAIRNAGRLLQEGGAAAVKMEGGAAVVDTAARLVDVGIPVMGHLGLLPQSVHQVGGYRRAAESDAEAEQLIRDAKALESAGVFAIVLEFMPAEVARRVTAELSVPTIGIGAGPHCDGQVLVSYDAFGLFDRFVPGFVKRYAELGAQMVEATRNYIADVQEGRFPAAEPAKAARKNQTPLS